MEPVDTLSSSSRWMGDNKCRLAAAAESVPIQVQGWRHPTTLLEVLEAGTLPTIQCDTDGEGRRSAWLPSSTPTTGPWSPQG